jgi:hypothetical protein
MLVSELQALVAESKRRHPEVREVCPCPFRTIFNSLSRLAYCESLIEILDPATIMRGGTDTYIGKRTRPSDLERRYPARPAQPYVSRVLRSPCCKETVPLVEQL